MMNFPKVDTFLCCISLESGGFIIGWISILCSIIFLIISSFLMVFISMFPEFLGDTSFFILFMITTVFYIVFSMMLLLTACIMMRGITKKNPNRLIPFMVVLVIAMVIGFLQVIMTGWSGVAPAVLLVFLDFYLLICIVSLYNKLEAEKKEEEDSRYTYITAITRACA